MEQVQNGHTVKVHYTGTLEDGTVFDSSVDQQPLEFTIGQNQIIRGFEQAVIGMSPGESKTTKVATDEAFGPHREDLVMQVERSQFPEELEPTVGRQIQLGGPSGQTVVATISDVTETTVKLDANHPLAGKNLTFDIELLQIV